MDEDVIDRRVYSSFGLFSQSEVAFDDIEGRIKEIIGQGEGPRVEFKRELNREKRNEYLESIVAFANSRGGLLIIGVNDSGEVVGFEEDIEELLTNQVHELCSPSIDFTVKSDIKIEGKEIAVVDVPSGNQKPYLLQGRGYIRRGATDRIMKREELEKLFDSDKSGLNPYFFYPK